MCGAAPPVLERAGRGRPALRLLEPVRPRSGGKPGARQGKGPTGKAIEPGKYRAQADCAELAPKLPLQPRDQGSDRHSSVGGETQTSCTWFGGKDGARTARVRWNLLADDGVRDTAKAQTEAFRVMTAGGTRTSVGFGDEAFHGASDTTTSCSLSVRGGNLVVRVDLGSEEVPAAACDSNIADIAWEALDAIPH